MNSLGSSQKLQLRNLNPILSLPIEISLNIFSYLPPQELHNCSKVNAQWMKLIKEGGFWKVFFPKQMFGQEAWQNYFEVDVEEISLPEKISVLLDRICLFTEGLKKVEETQDLIFIPSHIKEEPFNLHKLFEIVQERFPELNSDPPFFPIQTNQSEKIERGSWILVTKDAIAKTAGESFSQQQQVVQKLGDGKYRVPNRLEMATIVFITYARVRQKGDLTEENLNDYKRHFSHLKLMASDLFPNEFYASRFFSPIENGINALKELPQVGKNL